MNLSAALIKMARQSRPTIARTLDVFGGRTLKELAEDITSPTVESYQGRDDVWQAVEVDVGRRYGPKIAAIVAQDMRADPVLPTSNHYGIDTAADSIQGTILLALRKEKPRQKHPMAVFAFSTVSMNNSFSYPMGLLFYDHASDRIVSLPQRLPILPNKLKSRMVSGAARLDQSSIDRALNRVRHMSAEGSITPFAACALVHALEVDFGTQDVLGGADYLSQSDAVNNHLWRRVVRTPSIGSQFVQISIEKVCSELLARDLRDVSSLVSLLLFDSELNDRLLDRLDGEKACWRRHDRQKDRTPADGGTMFFWGVSADGRRIPLHIRQQGSKRYLRGARGRSESIEIDIEADAILDAIRAGIIAPSMFTCFAQLAFARGIHCVGGYYQSEYLAVMQQGIVDTLSDADEFRPVLEAIAVVPSDLCLSGVQAFSRRREDGSLLPVGSVELAEMGGIGDAELAAMASMPVRDACCLAFTEVFPQLVRSASLPSNWIAIMARENGERRASRHSKPRYPLPRSQELS